MSLRRTLLGLLATVSVTFFARGASAEPDEEAQRLMKLRDAERYAVQTQYSSMKAGAARVHVAAPTTQVKKVVSDFKNYSKFISEFEKSKVVGRDGEKTDVYLQVPILNGSAKIWAVVRFEPIKTVNGEEHLVGHMVKGNVKRLDATWRIKKIDDDDTQLHLELLIVPKMPVPGSVVTGQAKYAADVSVMSSRDRAEGLHAKKKGKK